MEFNIASRQTRDILRGAPSYRPSFNAYMWADAQAIARIADLSGDKANAEKFRALADVLKDRVQSRLWDQQREFFLIRFRDNESNEKDYPGKPIKAGTLIYEDGPFAGSPEGRELIGYVPWQFNLPDAGYESAWKFLMDPKYFFAPFGPSFVGATTRCSSSRPPVAGGAASRGPTPPRKRSNRSPTCSRTTDRTSSPAPTTSACCASTR